MENEAGSKSIDFLGKAYSFLSLSQAIGKANDSYVETGKPVYAKGFDQNLLPTATRFKYRKPIITVHEGCYVIIYMSESDMNEFIEIKMKDGKEIKTVKKGFKATFLTKFAFNQCKVVEVPTEAVESDMKSSETRNNLYGNRNRTSTNPYGAPRRYGDR